eukprot:scaffold13688_cov59-Phaeocystis_antarctica.AAC.4
MMRAAGRASRWPCGPCILQTAGRCGHFRRAARCWPWLAAGPARMLAVPPLVACRSGLAEWCSRKSRMERWPWFAASMSAVTPRPLGRSTLAPRFSSSLAISRRPQPAAACSKPKAVARLSLVVVGQSASISPPLRSHLTTFCSSPRLANPNISSGSEAGELTAGSPVSSGAASVAAGCGGAACCRMSFAVAVWPFSSAHHRAMRPSLSSSWVLALTRSRACTHASCPSPAAIIRAVKLSPDCRLGLAEWCRRKSRMERWPRYAAFMSAVVPRLPCKSTLAPRFSSTLTISSWPLAAAMWSRPTVAVWPSGDGVGHSASTGPPLRSHLTTFCNSPCPADLKISAGSGAGELTAGSPASGGAAGVAAAGCGGGAVCCRMSSTARWSSPCTLVHWVLTPANSTAWMQPSIL